MFSYYVNKKHYCLDFLYFFRKKDKLKKRKQVWFKEKIKTGRRESQKGNRRKGCSQSPKRSNEAFVKSCLKKVDVIRAATLMTIRM